LGYIDKQEARGHWRGLKGNRVREGMGTRVAKNETARVLYGILAKNR